jgi:hypothetical protein
MDLIYPYLVKARAEVSAETIPLFRELPDSADPRILGNT